MITNVYARDNSDIFFSIKGDRHCSRGAVFQAESFLKREQLLDRKLWHLFVDQYLQNDADSDNGWRGEYWGKMMMGACYICQMTRDETLYTVIEETVKEMLDAQREDGRISTYATDHQLRGWDIWSRKYVMLGMEYFLEFCKDEVLRKAIVDSLCRQMDALLVHLGDGKTPVCEASDLYRGLNSSSILEPVVLLYQLTDKAEYLSFAKHIVACGGTSICDIFTRALENHFSPYQYPVTKAYEMISCFEGLIELWRVTGDINCKLAAIRFTDKVLETDFTIIGSCGCTHEFFDHSTVRQANENVGPLMQETCVTVSLMKLLWQVTRITGDMKYMDAFERAFYNAYLGSFNTEYRIPEWLPEKYPQLVHKPMPFDSYSPLTAGYRGREIGGFQIMSSGEYYGCCACIGSTGVGLFHKAQLLNVKDGLVLTLYDAGAIYTHTPNGQKLCIEIDTRYPSAGDIHIHMHLKEREHFRLYLRIPGWSRHSSVLINGQSMDVVSQTHVIDRQWEEDDCVTLRLDFGIRTLRPKPYGNDVLMTGIVWEKDYAVAIFDQEPDDAKHHLAVQIGPLTLAAEQRTGWIPDTFLFPKEYCIQSPSADQFASVLVRTVSGESIQMVNYSSTGKYWGPCDQIAAWIPVPADFNNQE